MKEEYNKEEPRESEIWNGTARKLRWEKKRREVMELDKNKQRECNVTKRRDTG